MSDFTPHDAPVRDPAALPVVAKVIGRDQSLIRVHQTLKNNQAITITGPAGIGKTALAATLAGAYAQQPGGVLWFYEEGSKVLNPFEHLLVRVGRAYNVPEITGTDTPLAMVGAVASTLASNKPLLVLDGKLDPTAVREFLTKCAMGIPAIIVSETAIPGIESVELGKLDPAPAAALYKALSGETDDATIATLLMRLDYHPFAIMLTAGSSRIGKKPASAYLTAFQQLPAGNPLGTALTAAFQLLQPAALQGLLLTLGSTIHGAASSEMLSMLSAAPEATVQQAMQVLVAQGLVERSVRYGAPYYRLHPIVHTFTQNALKASQRLDGLQTKVGELTLRYAQKYGNAESASHDKLAAEMDAFLSVAEWAADSGDRETANQFVLALTQAGGFATSRGYVYELLRLRNLASGMTTAFPAYSAQTAVPLLDEDDDLDEDFDEEDEDSNALDRIEDDEDEFGGPQDTVARLAAIKLEDASIEELRAELATAKQNKDRSRVLTLLRGIGRRQAEQHMENEAISTYTEALMLYEAAADNAGVLDMLDTLSVLMTKTENSQAAVLNGARGVKLADQLGDQDTKMHLLITLGDARQQLGESSEAIRAYGQALEIARTRDDEQNEAQSLLKLGFAQLDDGDSDEAVNTFNEALKLLWDQKKRDQEGKALGGLGTANGELGRWSEAINLYTSALHIAREVHDKEEEALQLNNLGYAAMKAYEQGQKNQLGQALLRYRQALHLAYQDDDDDQIVTTLIEIVRILLHSPRHWDIGELLVDEALSLEPNMREARQLKDKIRVERDLLIDQVAIKGTPRDYAANAYKLLDE
jgi:tetratricopeptide (TPR) repeat protein